MLRNRYSLGSVADEGDTGVDLTPMLDVVFIMLIFFIVTASFVKESGIDVNRPPSVTANEKKDTAWLIGIDAQNRVWIDGHPIDVRSVRAFVERLYSQYPEGGLVIQADESASVKRLTQVLDAARAVLPHHKISLATDAG